MSKKINKVTLIGTIPIIILVIFIEFLTLEINNQFNIINASITFLLSIYMFSLYYYDGEKSGYNDTDFNNNRDVYNKKAYQITEQHNFEKLREYCEYEFQVRKTDYYNQLATSINMTITEIEQNFKKFSVKEIKKLNTISINGNQISIDKKIKKVLIKVLYEPCPVMKNEPNSIINARDVNIIENKKDFSKTHKTSDFIYRVLRLIVVAFIFGIINITEKDGEVIVNITLILTYLTNVITNAVAGYTAGNRNIVVYKNQYYIELANFIDNFNEYLKNHS